MPVIRVNHTDNYTVMSNYHLRDKKLSLKAKGLLSQMLSLPPNWDYTVAGLVAINAEKNSAITTALKELRDFGYLVITKRFPNETETGRIEYIYDIYEQPQEKQAIEKQDLEFLGVEFQGLENQTQLNTKQLNTDKLNTHNKRFVPPTLEEVKAYCKERGNNVNPETWFDFYTANGFKVGRNQMKDWKASIRYWERGENNGKNILKRTKNESCNKPDPQTVREAYKRLVEEGC